MTRVDVAEIAGWHPALLDAAVRWRGVGGWGATATLMRAIGAGAVDVEAPGGVLTLRLVGGVSTSHHPLPHGPFVEQHHVDGLDAIDRHLLVMIFDDIAKTPETDLPQLAAYTRSNPLSFWRRLRVWRDEVNARASKLRTSESLLVSHSALQAARGALVDSLYDSGSSNAAWSRVAGAALVAGLDDVVVKTARERCEGHPDGPHCGPAAVVWLASLTSKRRPGIDVIRRLFSPLRPSSYPPAQYTGLTLPFWYRVRAIDDGSQRLGG